MSLSQRSGALYFRWTVFVYECHISYFRISIQNDSSRGGGTVYSTVFATRLFDFRRVSIITHLKGVALGVANSLQATTYPEQVDMAREDEASEAFNQQDYQVW